MIQPREEFRKSDDAKRWPDVVDSPLFQRAVQAAFLEMQLMTTGLDMGAAAAAQFRMDGAKLYLTILMGLADPVGTAKTPPPQNLQHNLK